MIGPLQTNPGYHTRRVNGAIEIDAYADRGHWAEMLPDRPGTVAP